jgi:hypothetical protein
MYSSELRKMPLQQYSSEKGHMNGVRGDMILAY